MGYRFLPSLSAEEIADRQLAGLRWTVGHALAGSSFYQSHLRAAGVAGAGDIRSLDDLARLPLTTVDHLRQGYPLPFLAVAEEQVVRIHASSGTTGKRKILAYTQGDVDTWKHMMARCFELAGLTTRDRVQICVGYGLWTAGAGFQLGCEHFGAMALPVGPGLLDIQLQMLTDLNATTLCSTASMALLMAEEVEKRGLASQVALQRCIFGAEAHSPKMRQHFEELLGLEHSFDIIGMTELYGPGTGLDCQLHTGIHYWADLYILEILDPETLQPVAPGEVGEMVVTSLRKEAAPLIRYRTRDLTRLIPGDCPCGLTLPRQDRILGRSDDMFIIRGVNIYPGQIAAVLGKFPEVSSEYQIRLTRSGGKDFMDVAIERRPGGEEGQDRLASAIAERLHKELLVRAGVHLVAPGELPRTFAKSKRVVDERGQEETANF